jgi:hypothetical protein
MRLLLSCPPAPLSDLCLLLAWPLPLSCCRFDDGDHNDVANTYEAKHGDQAGYLQ